MCVLCAFYKRFAGWSLIEMQMAGQLTGHFFADPLKEPRKV
jgi:hypothetical protein